MKKKTNDWKNNQNNSEWHRWCECKNIFNAIDLKRKDQNLCFQFHQFSLLPFFIFLIDFGAGCRKLVRIGFCCCGTCWRAQSKGTKLILIPLAALKCQIVNCLCTRKIHFGLVVPVASLVPLKMFQCVIKQRVADYWVWEMHRKFTRPAFARPLPTDFTVPTMVRLIRREKERFLISLNRDFHEYSWDEFCF